MDQGSSLLLGIEGLIVDRVLIDDAGRRVVHCSTDPELAGWCPACRQQSSPPKARVTTRPRDVRIGPDRPVLLWHKRKWHCRVPECERKVFTESLHENIRRGPGSPPGPRRAAEVSIGDHCRPIARARSASTPSTVTTSPLLRRTARRSTASLVDFVLT